MKITKEFLEKARGLQTEDWEQVDQLLKTLRYIIGIAERGEGRKWDEAETAEQFVLNYVKKLEAASAPTGPAQGIPLPPDVLHALRFYANGEHLAIDDEAQEFDTVSGEPGNWLHSQHEDDCTMIENGSIAKAVLQGKHIDVDVDQPGSAPIEGEIYSSATPAPEVEPVAVSAYSYGGSTGINDYLMSDGSIKSMRPEEVAWAGDRFQRRVKPWMMTCFGSEISADTVERNHRFLEEALELVQACGCTQDEAHQLVDYVYNRPPGDKQQEVGGVMVTLAALCLAHGLDMHQAGEIELARIWTKIEQIRTKQAAKPKYSPLPAETPEAEPTAWAAQDAQDGFDFIAGWPELVNEHINEAIADGGCNLPYRIVPLYAHPQNDGLIKAAEEICTWEGYTLLWPKIERLRAELDKKSPKFGE